jgi:hypothetical protein
MRKLKTGYLQADSAVKDIYNQIVVCKLPKKVLYEKVSSYCNNMTKNSPKQAIYSRMINFLEGALWSYERDNIVFCYNYDNRWLTPNEIYSEGISPVELCKANLAYGFRHKANREKEY